MDVSKVKRHEFQVHGVGPKQSRNYGEFKCSVCAKLFKERGSLKHHYMIPNLLSKYEWLSYNSYKDLVLKTVYTTILSRLQENISMHQMKPSIQEILNQKQSRPLTLDGKSSRKSMTYR